MNIYNNKEILITGGTGSFGNEFCRKIVASKIQLRRMPKIIFIEDKTFDYANKLTNAIKGLN